MPAVIDLNKPKHRKKADCITKIKQLVGSYSSLIIFECDNVSSSQLKKVRVLTRDQGVLVMGKNSLFKKGFQAKMDKSGKLERVVQQLFGNVGLLFTNKDLKETRDLLESISEMAPVKAGIVAQCDIVIPKGITGLPPDKTSFFQALNISTMINKSAIEIMSDIPLLKKGQRVGASEATLLQMLNIRPFSYKLHSRFIFDNGMSYPPEVLDLTQSDILAAFNKGVSDVACVSLAINYPTRVSVSHVIQSSLMDLICVCLEAEISNDIVDEFKAAASTVQTAISVQKTETKVTETAPVVAEEEESDGDMGLGLFGDD